MKHRRKSKHRGVDGQSQTEMSMTRESQARAAAAAAVKGSDDMGNFYNCHADLIRAQGMLRDDAYKAVADWWAAGGYGGVTDDEAMIGDTDGLLDGAEGLAFLDRVLATDKDGPPRRLCLAVDIGAGVGRVSKLILLKRYKGIRLVEGDASLSKRSRVYLGRKRASRCVFSNCFLQNLSRQSVLEWGAPADIMWIQWTLQYLTDNDVVECLKILSGGLRAKVGLLIVKENRPFGDAREDRFQMDTPKGVNRRYDITRTDAHHRLLFQKASLAVDCAERGTETNSYALSHMAT